MSFLLFENSSISTRTVETSQTRKTRWKNVLNVFQHVLEGEKGVRSSHSIEELRNKNSSIETIFTYQYFNSKLCKILQKSIIRLAPFKTWRHFFSKFVLLEIALFCRNKRGDVGRRGCVSFSHGRDGNWRAWEVTALSARFMHGRAPSNKNRQARSTIGTHQTDNGGRQPSINRIASLSPF